MLYNLPTDCVASGCPALGLRMPKDAAVKPQKRNRTGVLHGPYGRTVMRLLG